MKIVTQESFASALISAVVGTILTLIFEPLVALPPEGIVLRHSGGRPPRIEIKMSPTEAPPPLPLPPPPPPEEAEPPPPPEEVAPLPPPEEVRPSPTGDKNGLPIVKEFTDKDEYGTLTFEAFILTQNFRWKYASDDQVKYPSSQVVQSVPTYLKNHLSYRLKDARDVISVGMSSCEGDRPGEEERARNRAEQLNLWVQQARPDNKPRNYYIVNLGQYKKHNCQPGKQPGEDETSDQRRIVILYVTRKESIRNLEDIARRILRQLKKDSHLLFDPSDYSMEFVLAGERPRS